MMQRFGVTERQDFNLSRRHETANRRGPLYPLWRGRALQDWMEQTTGTEGADAFCPNAAPSPHWERARPAKAASDKEKDDARSQ
jgi:hypothetical protein